MTDDARVDILVDQINGLRRDLTSTIAELRAAVVRLDDRTQQNDAGFTEKCEQNRAAIQTEIRALHRADAELAERQFRYFVVGAGIGVLIGAATTSMIGWLVMRGLDTVTAMGWLP